MLSEIGIFKILSFISYIHTYIYIEGDHVGVTNEGDCCRVVWNDNYSTPTVTIFIDRDLVYSELRS